MIPVSDSFSYDYFGSEIVYGRGCIEDLEEDLSDRDLDRVLVVCGSNVGANDSLMEPVRRGLGDRMVGVFDETTPRKRATAAYAGLEMMKQRDVDSLLAVGGGSSIDIARFMSVLESDGRSLAELQEEIDAGEGIRPVGGTGPVTPTIAVPTTFAGADISTGGSLVLSAADEPPVGEIQTVGLADQRVAPIAMYYDPDLFETTPIGALAGSAMNGFDKGIETLYASEPTPVTDATAVHGLRLLEENLPRLVDEDPEAMERAIIGIILVQYRRKTSIVHAFGHGLARRYPVQQGVVHAVLVPHVLRYVFEQTHGRRELHAEGLGIDARLLSNEQIADEIIDAVAAVRDGLDLPARLRELDPVDSDDFPAIAEFIREDHMMGRTAGNVEPTVEEIEAILEAAW